MALYQGGLNTNSGNKKRVVTKPINNTGFGLYERFVYFYEVRKIFGILLFSGTKKKRKPKNFAMCVAESKR